MIVKLILCHLLVSLAFNAAAQPPSRAQWEQRKDSLVRCISELFMERGLLSSDSPIVSSATRTYKDYSVRNIALETLPGLYVCASVYQPARLQKAVPAVLVPNGHFNGGRYRADIQYICASLARMGAIAVSYDLFGWGESRLQVKDEDHYSPIAMEVQRFNATRIINYLGTLRKVDTTRIAITGASGGGSQSMLTTALDSRIAVSVPVVMLSATFPGGCPCEIGIPIHQCVNGTNNLEIAAAAAPRPQLIISCGKDWTATVPQKEFPYLQAIYKLYGKEQLVQNIHLDQEGHDYGVNKRKAMYRFMAEHLGLKLRAITDKRGNIDESGAFVEDESMLLVFGDNGQLLPPSAIRNVEQLKMILPIKN